VQVSIFEELVPHVKLAAKKAVIEIGSSDLASGLIDGIAKPTKSIGKIREAKSYEDLSDFNC
jgi:hypothetical protein